MLVCKLHLDWEDLYMNYKYLMGIWYFGFPWARTLIIRQIPCPWRQIPWSVQKIVPLRGHEVFNSGTFPHPPNIDLVLLYLSCHLRGLDWCLYQYKDSHWREALKVPCWSVVFPVWRSCHSSKAKFGPQWSCKSDCSIGPKKNCF